MIADITRPPKKPSADDKAITAAWPWENGVIGAIRAAMAVADKIPPTVRKWFWTGKARHDFCTANQFAPNVLQHIRYLYHANQEDQQQDIVAVIEAVQV